VQELCESGKGLKAEKADCDYRSCRGVGDEGDVKFPLDPKKAQSVLDEIARQLPHLKDALQQLPSKLGILVEIKPAKVRQTDDQRGYYWLSLHYWGNEAGYSAKEAETWLHNAVCCEAFGVAKRMQVGGSLVEIPNQTSSKLGIEDYSLLIETMIRMAAHDGVAIPEPERVA
jgi:hypothetical protein